MNKPQKSGQCDKKGICQSETDTTGGDSCNRVANSRICEKKHPELKEVEMNLKTSQTINTASTTSTSATISGASESVEEPSGGRLITRSTMKCRRMTASEDDHRDVVEKVSCRSRDEIVYKGDVVKLKLEGGGDGMEEPLDEDRRCIQEAEAALRSLSGNLSEEVSFLGDAEPDDKPLFESLFERDDNDKPDASESVSKSLRDVIPLASSCPGSEEGEFISPLQSPEAQAPLQPSEDAVSDSDHTSGNMSECETQSSEPSSSGWFSSPGSASTFSPSSSCGDDGSVREHDVTSSNFTGSNSNSSSFCNGGDTQEGPNEESEMFYTMTEPDDVENLLKIEAECAHIQSTAACQVSIKMEHCDSEDEPMEDEDVEDDLCQRLRDDDDDDEEEEEDDVDDADEEEYEDDIWDERDNTGHQERDCSERMMILEASETIKHEKDLETTTKTEENQRLTRLSDSFDDLGDGVSLEERCALTLMELKNSTILHAQSHPPHLMNSHNHQQSQQQQQPMRTMLSIQTNDMHSSHMTSGCLSPRPFESMSPSLDDGMRMAEDSLSPVLMKACERSCDAGRKICDSASKSSCGSSTGGE